MDKKEKELIVEYIKEELSIPDGWNIENLNLKNFNGGVGFAWWKLKRAIKNLIRTIKDVLS